MEDPQKTPLVWIPVWSPDGYRASVNLPLGHALTAEEVSALLGSFATLRDAGLLPSEPTLADGEQIQDIGFVSRSFVAETDVVNFYSTNAAMNFRIVGVFMNTPEDRQAFNRATGLRVEDLPLYDGKGHPEKNDQTNKYLVKLTAPIKIKIKRNPNYVEGDLKKQKHLFVDYAGGSPAAPVVQPPTPSTGEPPASTSGDLLWDALEGMPPVPFNESTLHKNVAGIFNSPKHADNAIKKLIAEKVIDPLGTLRDAEEALRAHYWMRDPTGAEKFQNWLMIQGVAMSAWLIAAKVTYLKDYEGTKADAVALANDLLAQKKRVA